MLPYVTSVYQTFKLMVYEVTLVWRWHSSDEAVLKLMQLPENCMIRRSIKHKTHTRTLNQNRFQGQYHINTVISFWSNKHSLTAMDNEFLLVVYNLDAPCSYAKKTKKKKSQEIMWYAPQFKKGQIYSNYFLFEPSDVIKIKRYWYGVFLLSLNSEVSVSCIIVYSGVIIFHLSSVCSV